MIGVTILIKSPPIFRDFCHGWQQVAIHFLANHSSSTWLLHFLSPFFLDLFAALFITLAVCMRALFSKSASIFGTCRTSILEGATFHRMSYCKFFFKVILAGPSRHCTTGTLSSGTSGSRRISLILLHERIRRRIRLCRFCTLINIVAETAIVSFRTLPVGFPLPTNLLEFFVHAVLSPWFLTTAFLS